METDLARVAVVGARVMAGPELGRQRGVRRLFGVERHLQRLRVVPDGGVIRERLLATRVPHLRCRHAGEPGELVVRAPKSPQPEHNCALIVVGLGHRHERAHGRRLGVAHVVV